MIDLSVIQLLEEKRLKKADFIVAENYHLRLKASTAEMLIDKIRLNFNRQVSYKGKNHTFQNILLDNVQQRANFIVGKKKDVKFSIPVIKLQRNDSLELQRRILKMSHSRNAPGKSTACYRDATIEVITEAEGIQVMQKYCEFCIKSVE